MRPIHTLLAILLTLASVMIGGAAGARQTTPVTSEGGRPDLAAMALSPDDVPAGYFEDSSEWLASPSAFSELVLGGSAVPADLDQVYQSFYVNDAEQLVIQSYLFSFTSAEAASAGIDILDMSFLRPPLPEGSIDGPTTEAGPALGDQSTSITRVTYDTRGEGGPLVDVVAFTFRRDSIIAGVSIERYADPVSDGTPASPESDTSETDADFSVRLAGILDERITTVTAGQPPSGVDFSLSAMILPVDQLAAGAPVIGGYKPGIDLLRCGLCGEENSLLPFADDALDGVSRTIFVGPLVDGEPSPPFVSVAIIPFTGPNVALDALEAIRHAPNDRPTPGPVPRGDRTLVADPEIPGATGTLGFEAILDAEAPDAAPDSAGVTFVMESWLVTVDVQGGLPADTALEVAIDLGTQQAECLAGGGPCQHLTVPPGLLTEPDATPGS